MKSPTAFFTGLGIADIEEQDERQLSVVLPRQDQSAVHVVLVDADRSSLLDLGRLLMREPDMTIVGRTAKPEDVPALLRRTAPDVVFVDAGLSHLITAEDQAASALIFTSTTDAAARMAFDAGAIDYLLKPFQPGRVAEAASRLRERRRLSPPVAALDQVNRLLRQTGDPPEPKNHDQRPLLIKMSDRSVLIRPEQIDWLEANGKYVNVHSGRQTFPIRDSLTRLETVLDSNRFIRVHRSRIVQLARISELRSLKYGDREAILCDGTRLCISRMYADRLAVLLSAAV